MKKIKSILCVALLSVFLTGNTFAGDTTGGYGIYSFFGNMVNAVYSLFGADDDDCRPRICQQCRPDQKDSDGNCRPTEG
jgi:hypothetical protein